jgi:hypothetical protein
MMQRMNSIPATREEFERNLFLMKEAMRSGKLRFGVHLYHSIRGIQRVRKLPNSRIDLLSVDEIARLTANMLANIPTAPREPGPDDELE